MWICKTFSSEELRCKLNYTVDVHHTVLHLYFLKKFSFTYFFVTGITTTAASTTIISNSPPQGIQQVEFCYLNMFYKSSNF